MQEEKQDQKEQQLRTISADTFKRMYLLSMVAGFSRGVYGAKRLQKITYLVERKQMDIRPFEFKKYHYGQFSETLEEIKEQLISLGLIAAIPLNASVKISLRLPDDKTVEWLEGGVRYIISDPQITQSLVQTFQLISPNLMLAIRSTIRSFGYLPEQELIERCYALPEFIEADFEDTLFESNISDRIEVTNLNEDTCEEMEMALSPKFVVAMKKIVEGIENSRLDLEKVRKVAVPV